MNKHFFNLARTESHLATYSGGARIGCVLVYGGSVVARGHNEEKTHPVQERQNLKFRYKNTEKEYFAPKVHAEIATLMKVRWAAIDWRYAELYIYREYADKRLAICRPCLACLDVIVKQFGIRTIHYTTELGFATERVK